jgi:hypothetical protein
MQLTILSCNSYQNNKIGVNINNFKIIERLKNININYNRFYISYYTLDQMYSQPDEMFTQEELNSQKIIFLKNQELIKKGLLPKYNKFYSVNKLIKINNKVNGIIRNQYQIIESITFEKSLHFLYNDYYITISYISDPLKIILTSPKYFTYHRLQKKEYELLNKNFSDDDKKILNDIYIINPNDNYYILNDYKKKVPDGFLGKVGEIFLKLNYIPDLEKDDVKWNYGIDFEELTKRLDNNQESKEMQEWYNSFDEIIKNIKLY